MRRQRWRAVSTPSVQLTNTPIGNLLKQQNIGKAFVFIRYYGNKTTSIIKPFIQQHTSHLVDVSMVTKIDTLRLQ
jgi:hypothetical protein